MSVEPVQMDERSVAAAAFMRRRDEVLSLAMEAERNAEYERSMALTRVAYQFEDRAVELMLRPEPRG